MSRGGPAGRGFHVAQDRSWVALSVLSCKKARIRVIIIITFAAAAVVAARAVPVPGPAEAPPWVPDSGDGSYHNPVLFADYSDPDAIRVGSDFYLVASSFQCAPGLPILRSPDLVNWTLVGHALPALTPADHFASPRRGAGVWAPSIREHAGRFFIYYPDPDFGIFAVTAAAPSGPWSAPVLVEGGRGLIDPCPFWDDDGQAYIVHGWARSRAGISNRLTLEHLSPDGLGVLPPARTIIDAELMAGWRTLEGPKMYRRGEWYYIFAPAGGVTQGYQAVFRSRSPWGPYDNRVVLRQGSTPINGPHQGAWVTAPDGTDWFLHFQDRGAFGRVVHLEPLNWRADGWPVIGSDPEGTGCGFPVAGGLKPVAIHLASPLVPAASDAFDGPALAPQWQWQSNPSPSWWSLTENPGHLSLRSTAPPGPNLGSSGALLLQKFAGPAFAADTLLDFGGAAPGDRAGLIVFGADYAWIGLRRTADGFSLVQSLCRASGTGALETEAATLPSVPARVWLRVEVDAAAQCRFFWSVDGKSFAALGSEFSTKPDLWVGAKVGLFAAAADSRIAGRADYDWFRMTRLVRNP